jgi:hypothetical protein
MRAGGLVRSRADIAPVVEILRVAREDFSVVTEAWGAYVVSVTLTFSDGRVLTFVAGS